MIKATDAKEISRANLGKLEEDFYINNKSFIDEIEKRILSASEQGSMFIVIRDYDNFSKGIDNSMLMLFLKKNGYEYIRNYHENYLTIRWFQ